MNKLWIGTNWKMTKGIADGLTYTKELKRISEKLSTSIELFIIPSYTALVPIKEEVRHSRIHLGAQNMHWENEGAFTGEISPKMLKEIGIDIVELGHSERRQYYNENDRDINKKVHAGLHYGFTPLVCIGENIEQKNNNISKETLAMQLKVCLKDLTKEQADKVMVAYEPVWAIGEKGTPADPEYVAHIHRFIRQTLVEMFGEAGYKVILLFGGSVSKHNFLDYINSQDVNGLFIGRAAWNTKSFEEILTKL
ncbi:triosephosphate isomerase (TIM) [Salinibacillus kushneri]|uniref:Triosephosphate isomerase n=1 Tax=Salinibacillus kushneri TaxID=237682 RepID=A0A1H9Z9A1_9BACI|nr:triose-phosphate isomerase [Salinibacillus kushneri]SES78091.1 triosephosphate isomerase (TIM) [Salinibacillus kushneri]